MDENKILKENDGSYNLFLLELSIPPTPSVDFINIFRWKNWDPKGSSI